MEVGGDEEYFDSFQEAVEEEVRPPADATDPLAPDAEEPESDPISPARPIELDSGGKIRASGAGKLAGSWNYTHVECSVVAWAALAASELGITDMEGLHGRVRDFYLPKALEIARSGGWTNALSRASKKKENNTADEL